MATVDPNVKYTIPFFMVKNMQASLNFYVGGLGFSVEDTWQPEW